MASLIGKRIVITRPRAQSGSFAKLLQKEGAETIIFPTIQISPPEQAEALDKALLEISTYDWIVFTSVNGIESVWDRLSILEIEQIPSQVKIAAIGPKTAKSLMHRGRQPDFVPDEYILEEIVPGLGDLRGKRVLLARADRARSILPNMIRENGGQVDDLVAYRTLPAKSDQEGLAAITVGVDMITFTSPSSIDNFIDLMEKNKLSIYGLMGTPTFAYIGPVTARRAQELNLPHDVVAQEYTIEGLIRAIIDFYARKEFQAA